MIIVSQDKKEIINFDNLVSVYVIESYEAKEKGLKKYNIDFATTDEINFIIGTYETEERAKEVLKEIIEQFTVSKIKDSNYEYADLVMKVKKLSAFEMPEE